MQPTWEEVRATGQVLQDVADERTRQRQMWGNTHDDSHSTLDWLILIQHWRDGALIRADNITKLRKSYVDIAAIAVAAIEQIDRGHL